MGEIGSLAITFAFVVSIYGLLAPLLGIALRRQDLVASARGAVFASLFLLSVASVALLSALLGRDFGNSYVASYSSAGLGFWYTVSAFWAGQAGSLLFWALLLAAFGSAVVWQHSGRRELLPYVIATLMGTLAFFTMLLVFISGPFERLAFPPADGAGLNPLLQNPGMFFHPPTQYIGYVAFTIPFAFAIAAMASRKLDDEWLRATRRWTLAAWLFLSLGVLFGMQWAYVELGWGGYWAWDPVENASLMPWLTATAFLHSAMIQEKRDMLKVWNLVLIILTFLLSIFGTFLTRSGVLSSVHSFALSSMGPLFFAFMGIIAVLSLGLLIVRLPSLRSTAELDSIVSRESSFLFNNLILVGAAFSVFLGTTFPLLSEAFRGVKISVGPPFFNQVNVPIGLSLLLLMGLCPLLAWRKASSANLKRNFLLPAAAAVLTAAALVLFGPKQPIAIAAFALSAFVTVAIGGDFHRGAMVRRSHGEAYPVALARMVARNHRRYGGYVVHIGIILLFAGMAGAAFSTQREAVLRRGETVSINQYTLRYEGASTYPTSTSLVTAATLSVFNSNKPIGVMNPQRNIHRGHEDQPMTEVAIRSTIWEDLYVILAGLGEDGTANFRVIINPLMMWMWAGGILLVAGTMIAFWPERGESLRNRARYLVEGAP
ncbi:MAG TPA: heme lyase CcmF/NrfE family subunit [bacterium]|nr:heme lyase CcmF/NrfE family subunit [bacterium]